MTHRELSADVIQLSPARPELDPSALRTSVDALRALVGELHLESQFGLPNYENAWTRALEHLHVVMAAALRD